MSAQAVEPMLAQESRLGDSKLRLTRRGRVVFGAIGMVAAAALLALLAALGSTEAVASEASGTHQEFPYVVVQSGSTLWSVATGLDPESDPRDLVSEIVALNQLNGSGVDAGQPLAVPMRFAESGMVISADELGL